MAKFFVTTPIYYVNAKPHIGHVYSAIAADVLARFYAAKGEEVLFSTGVDENSQKNVEAAQKQGKEVQAYVDEMAKVWEDTFKEVGLSYTKFVRTTSREHAEAVVSVIKKIQESDNIYLGDYIGFYCVGCEEFKAPNELVDGKCPLHHTEPKEIKEKNYFFKLSSFREVLLDHYKNNPDFVQPASARNKMLHYIEHEMEDISISRQSQDWGIRMPGDDSHAVYVWFDALINYLTVTGYPNEEKAKQWWPANLHIIGKDIIKFHCAIWPAMLMAAGLEIPNKIFAHGFFTIDGQKISKSLGNAIDPIELKAAYPFDAVRYYLLREIPFGGDGDFSLSRLEERYESDLAKGLGNLVSRTLNMIEKFWPDYDGGGNISAEYEGHIAQSIDSGRQAIENLEFEKAFMSLWEVVAWADKRIEETKPWQMAKEGKISEIQGILQDLYKALELINTELAPLLPQTHTKLSAILAARPIKKPTEPLFPPL